MAKAQTPAAAEPTVVTIGTAAPSRKLIGDKQVSFVTFKGKAPKTGEKIEFTIDSGQKYQATVKEAVDVRGQIMCELSDGPFPVTSK